MKFETHKVIWALVALSVVWFGAAMLKPAHALDNQFNVSVSEYIYEQENVGKEITFDGRYGILEAGAGVTRTDEGDNDIAVQAGLVKSFGNNFGISAGVVGQDFDRGGDTGAAYIAGIFDTDRFEVRIQHTDYIRPGASHTTSVGGRLYLSDRFGLEGSATFLPGEDDETYTAGVTYRF